MRVNAVKIAGIFPARFAGPVSASFPTTATAEGVFLDLTLRENYSLGFLNEISRLGIVDRATEAAKRRKYQRGLRVRAASIKSDSTIFPAVISKRYFSAAKSAAQPTVLLVDEPTKGVDIGARGEIYQRLRDFADQGVAVVVSSSDGIELEGICDRVLIFARGRIVDELAGDDVTDAAITKANLTATVSRTSKPLLPRSGKFAMAQIFSGDHFLRSCSRGP